jgi:hypothetical protein
VRRETKVRLAEGKADYSFDQILRNLLEFTPIERVITRLNGERRWLQLVAERRRTLAAAGNPMRRTPSKQLLIAALAEQRWRMWLESGTVTRVGPRNYRWNGLARPEGGESVNVRIIGRGVPPGGRATN